MNSARIHLEQVYHNLGSVRETLAALSEKLPITNEPVIRMGGGFHRHGGLDDWFADMIFASEISEHQLTQTIADLPYTHGITFTTP